jgi:hypothetical protein
MRLMRRHVCARRMEVMRRKTVWHTAGANSHTPKALTPSQSPRLSELADSRMHADFLKVRKCSTRLRAEFGEEALTIVP